LPQKCVLLSFIGVGGTLLHISFLMWLKTA
jgi:hypothetical protein